MWLNRKKIMTASKNLRLEYTFNTVGDMVLGPLDEKDATLGDIQFPITVFGKLRLAIGNLPHENMRLILILAQMNFRSQCCESMHYFLTLLF